jgi:putative flippase GtrA
MLSTVRVRSRRGHLPDLSQNEQQRSIGLKAQAGRFALVGIANTLLDYVLFIGLTKVFSIPLNWVWVAKAISGAIAIVNSFYLNRAWVFQNRGTVAWQAPKFVIATLIGVYAIQTPITQLFTSVIAEPGERFYETLHALGVTQVAPSVITEPLTVKTAAFVLATAASMTWNFWAYRLWVFARPSGRRCGS